MEPGRRWAIETFGEHGVHIRERVAELVREEHLALVDAQEASGHRSQGVYGLYWRGILERFEEFENLPHAVLIRPGKAPYRIPVVNGVALFAWRWGRSRNQGMDTAPFATSDARMAMFELGSVPMQSKFSIGMPDPRLTDEEKELADAIEAAASNALVTTHKVVVVAISSSPMGLHEINWGEAKVDNEGYLDWAFVEDLLRAPKLGPVEIAGGGKSFTSGALPERKLRHQSQPSEDSGIPASEDD